MDVGASTTRAPRDEENKATMKSRRESIPTSAIFSCSRLSPAALGIPAVPARREGENPPRFSSLPFQLTTDDDDEAQRAAWRWAMLQQHVGDDRKYR